MGKSDRMIQDLHSHTRYSDCGRDEPRLIIEAAIEGGITDLGISDHNYGIGDALREYREELSLLKEEYKDRIRLYKGIEISSLPHLAPAEGTCFDGLDYCLLEHIDSEGTDACDLIKYALSFGIPCGIAHTDLFAYCEKRGLEPTAFFRELKENGIFWEMNVNYDSIHGWREHEYVQRFLSDICCQEIILESGICLSVGFDGHRVEDYAPDRVIMMNEFLCENSIPRFDLNKLS